MISAEIPSCPGYQATRAGEILNPKGKTLRQWSESADGALRVRACGKNRMVGFLVLSAFSGHPPSKDYRVKYLNDDCTDNRIENLVWARRKTAVTPPQPRALPSALEDEYDRLRLERLALVELMQT